MASKKYVRSLSLWLVIILLLMLLLSFTLVVKHWFLTSLLLLILMVLTAITLFNKIEQTNLKLASFLKLIFSGDSAVRFPEKNLGAGFEELHVQLNYLAEKINKLEQARQREESLFRSMVQHLNVGIFLLNAKHDVVLVNPIGQTFLNIRSTADQHQLQQRAPYFFNALEALRSQSKVLMEVDSQGEIQKWQVQRKALKQDNENYELFLVNNLQAELENKEAEVSEKLMHTLTHEIMNSISPITSLIDTLQLQLSGIDSQKRAISLSKENFEDLQTSARIIQKRSHGLIEFVERYSMLARLPRLRMERIEGATLLKELSVLMREELSRKKITLQTQTENQNITFRADRQLLLQVLINLVKNATEAYDQNSGIITISLAKGDGYNYISVRDHAGGVPKDIRKEIFLPFFSTREKGSGIGLSLSRKIIQAHHGRLYLRSHNDGAEFRIELVD